MPVKRKMKIRAHHLLCIPRFKGGGYNKNIRDKIRDIQKKIKENPDLKIVITTSCDDICNSCTFNINNKCMKKQNSNYWIKVQDSKVMKRLGIKNNQEFLAKDIFTMSINKITNKELKQICKGCEFLRCCLKYSLNKSFIKHSR